MGGEAGRVNSEVSKGGESLTVSCAGEWRVRGAHSDIS